MNTLTHCPACGHTVSVQASQCPQCGQPLRARGMWAFKLVIGVVFVAVALWFLWSTISEMHHYGTL